METGNADPCPGGSVLEARGFWMAGQRTDLAGRTISYLGHRLPLSERALLSDFPMMQCCLEETGRQQDTSLIKSRASGGLRHTRSPQEGNHPSTFSVCGQKLPQMTSLEPPVHLPLTPGSQHHIGVPICDQKKKKKTKQTDLVRQKAFHSEHLQ